MIINKLQDMIQKKRQLANDKKAARARARENEKKHWALIHEKLFERADKGSIVKFRLFLRAFEDSGMQKIEEVMKCEVKAIRLAFNELNKRYIGDAMSKLLDVDNKGSAGSDVLLLSDGNINYSVYGSHKRREEYRALEKSAIYLRNAAILFITCPKITDQFDVDAKNGMFAEVKSSTSDIIALCDAMSAIARQNHLKEYTDESNFHVQTSKESVIERVSFC